ncbi:MAG: hypothetical protein KA229_10710 [Chitinophagaceae bacterium]|nr:hypothetical protein [Chitinophagaceae bacterium]
MKFRKTSVIRFSYWGLAIVLIILQQISSSFSGKMAETIWQQLGLSQQQGTEQIRYSFASGYSNFYGARNARNIALGNRAAVAKNLFQYTRTYISSAEFKSFYAKERMAARPTEPTPAKSKEDIRKELIADTEKNIRDAEKAMATMGADLKKALLPSVEQAKKQVEDYKKPDNKIIEIHYQGELSRFKSDQEEYEKKMLYWQNNYPEDIRVLIKNRLEKYLTLAATVDFEAELVLKNGKKKFVNPAYESKHSDWKTIFRAGKEVYQIVKPLAEDWLSKL